MLHTPWDCWCIRTQVCKQSSSYYLCGRLRCNPLRLLLYILTHRNAETMHQLFLRVLFFQSRSQRHYAYFTNKLYSLQVIYSLQELLALENFRKNYQSNKFLVSPEEIQEIYFGFPNPWQCISYAVLCQPGFDLAPLCKVTINGTSPLQNNRSASSTSLCSVVIHRLLGYRQLWYLWSAICRD